MDHYAGWEPSYLKYTINLNEQALAGNLEPVASRDSEMTQLVNILSRRTKNNPLLIGDPGVGKTAVVEGLVQKIVAKDVPVSLQKKVILQLDFSALVAGTHHKGEFEERLKELVSDLMRAEDVILFIDDIHVLFADNSEKMNAAAIFKRYLDDNLLSFIGTTTQADYETYFDKNKSLERDFQVIHVDEPNDEDAFKMLQTARQKYEKFHNVSISDDVLQQTVSLAAKHIPARFMPDKAFDVIDEAAANVRMEIEKGKRGTKRVKKDDIEKVISDWIGVPIAKLTQDESKKLLQLEQLIHKKFVGQQHAVNSVAEAVRRGRIGLSSSTRPITSFLFSGTSGVGRSELVKIVAQILHDRDDTVLQLDMSEYMEKNDVSKLIGAPPGFAGYEEGGTLTSAISKQPSTIILMDNIEKAHPEVANILLQILEEGQVHDNKGKKVSFKNTMLFCTTNIGNDLIVDRTKNVQDSDIDQIIDSLQNDIKSQMLGTFQPELINRFDSIVGFRPLKSEDMKGISRLLTIQTAEQLKKQDYTLQITNQAIEALAQHAGDRMQGARPLRRIVTEVIENPVAVAIISQQFKPGDTVLVEYMGEKGFSISNNVAKILQTTQITLPNIRDIAKYDTAFAKKEEQRMKEVNDLYELFKKMAKPETITDPGQKQEVEELKRLLQSEKEKGNPTADVILLAIESFKQEKPSALPLPKINQVQIVSEEDYEEVKAIWVKNYLDRKTNGNSLEAQLDWVKKEGEATGNVIKLFTSEKVEDKDEAMKNLVGILPIFLIGGFTGEEILSYLKAKADAAKTAQTDLEEEIETSILVGKSAQTPQEKTMQMQQA